MTERTTKRKKSYCETRNCNHCNKTYSAKDVKRVFGKESGPALLGYCSAVCYTKANITT